MATCGYQDIAEFNRAELMVAPALQTEGKQLQRDQRVGMGSRGAAVARRHGVTLMRSARRWLRPRGMVRAALSHARRRAGATGARDR